MKEGHFTHFLNIILYKILCFKQPKEQSSMKKKKAILNLGTQSVPTLFLNKFLCLADNLGQKFT